MSQSVPTAQAHLRAKIRAAYVWTTAGNLLRHTIGFGISILLARLLQPSDYGLIGMVLVFSNILVSVQELGLGDAVVHFNEDESSLRTYYSVTLLAGVMSMSALLSASRNLRCAIRLPCCAAERLLLFWLSAALESGAWLVISSYSTYCSACLS